jgi:hypothetical protein
VQEELLPSVTALSNSHKGAIFGRMLATQGCLVCQYMLIGSCTAVVPLPIFEMLSAPPILLLKRRRIVAKIRKDSEMKGFGLNKIGAFIFLPACVNRRRRPTRHGSGSSRSCDSSGRA